MIGRTNAPRLSRSNAAMKTGHKGTYQCLVGARDRGRDWLETGIYAVFLASGLLAITQFALVDRAVAKTGKLSAHHHGRKAHPVAERLHTV